MLGQTLSSQTNNKNYTQISNDLDQKSLSLEADLQVGQRLKQEVRHCEVWSVVNPFRHLQEIIDAQSEALEAAELCDMSLSEFGVWIGNLSERVTKATNDESIAKNLCQKMKDIIRSGTRVLPYPTAVAV